MIDNMRNHNSYTTYLLLIITALTVFITPDVSAVGESVTSEEKVDLQISDVKWIPTNLVTGDEVKFSYRVTEINADSSYNKMLFVAALYIDGQKFDEHTVEYYGKMDVIMRFSKPWIATEGLHEARIVINNDIQTSDNKQYPINTIKIPESNEQNNEFVITLLVQRFRTSESLATLQINTEPPIPNLIISIDDNYYLTNKEGIVRVEVFKGIHKIELASPTSSELLKRSFVYWRDMGSERFYDTVIDADVQGRWHLVTAVFETYYRTAFTTYGLPEGINVRFSVKVLGIGKTWSGTFETPFIFTLPEWLRYNTLVSFSVEPTNIELSGQEYEFKGWKFGPILSTSSTRTGVVVPETYVALYGVSTSSPQEVSATYEKHAKEKLPALSPVDSANYIVFTDGTTVWAKNSGTAEIEFGGSDASKVIKWTIDNLSNGGEILIKEGTYIISSNISPKSNVWIQGEGIDKTVLLVSGKNGIFIKNNVTPMRNFTLADLTLDGNGTSSTLVNFNAHASEFKIVNCKLTNGAGFLAFMVGDLTNNILEKSNGGNDLVAGIYPGSIIKGNTFKDASGQGLTTGAGHDFIITNNYFANIATAAISFESISGDIHNIIVANNTFSGNGANDIQLFKGTYNIGNITITGNIGDSGILVGLNGKSNYNTISENYSKYISIHGHYNLIEGNHVVGSDENGITLHDGDRNFIIGNHVENSNRNGIVVQAGDFNVVAKNIFTNNGQEANNTYDQILLTSFGSADPDKNIIAYNLIIATNNSKTRFGINIKGDSNIVQNNQFVGQFSADLSDGGTNTNIIANLIQVKSVTLPVLISGKTSILVFHDLKSQDGIDQTAKAYIKLGSINKYWISNVTDRSFNINLDLDSASLVSNKALFCVLLDDYHSEEYNELSLAISNMGIC